MAIGAQVPGSLTSYMVVKRQDVRDPCAEEHSRQILYDLEADRVTAGSVASQ